MTTDDALFERAIRTYIGILALGEPLRVRIWDDRGLTMTQLRLMFTLFREDGVSLGTLAQRMSLSPSAMTGVIDRLKRMKLLRRRTDPTDRRVVRVYLTDEGRVLFAEFDAAGRAYVDAVVRRLGRDRLEAFIGVLTEFLEAAKQVTEVEVVA